MSHRATPPSSDLVYSELDLQNIREQWETHQKDLTVTLELARINGRLDALPEQIRQTARQIAIDVLTSQQQRTLDQRWAHWPTVLNLLIAAAMLFVIIHGGVFK